jgi:hypothetical protein
MKRLLVISHEYAPAITAEANLATRFTRALDDLGWEMTVLTVAGDKRFDLFKDNPGLRLPKRATIIRIPSPEFFLWAPRLVSRILRHALFMLGLPSADFAWYPRAVAAGQKLLRAGHFGLLYSRACCHVSNVAALKLKRQFQLPWLAHFSDPWVDSPLPLPTNGLQRRAIRRLERMIFEAADKVVLVSQEAADLVLKKYSPSWRDKVRVLPHAYDPEDAQWSGRAPVYPDLLHFVHAGVFYPEGRTPVSLFQAIRQVLDRHPPGALPMQFSFIGPMETKYQTMICDLGLDHVVKLHGVKSWIETMNICATAHVLVAIDAPSEGPSVFLPSKLFDYLPLRKPILGITPLRGATASLLRDLSFPIVDPGDVWGLADMLEKIMSDWQAKRLAVPPDFDNRIRKYELNNVASQLNSLLVELSNPRKQ